MKRRRAAFPVVSFVSLCFLVGSVVSGLASPTSSLLDQEFHLGGSRSQETQYFKMETRIITYAMDGTRTNTDIFRLKLKCVPAAIAKKAGDEYTCAGFTVQQGNGMEKDVPALAGWSYVFTGTATDKKDQVLGIDHAKFDGLTFADGTAVPSDKAYFIYNTFVDFHSFCNVFGDSTPEGKGIQDLRRIGQTIVHDAAFSEPPVDLGENVAVGSFFKNGEITLTLNGLSVVNGRPCALVGFDSGESSFKMNMTPAPNLEIHTVGSSHYSGDIFKDLETNWVQRVTMSEVVVSETTLPMAPNKVDAVVERACLIQNVSQEEFGTQ